MVLKYYYNNNNNTCNTINVYKRQASKQAFEKSSSIQFQDNRFSGYRVVRCGQADRKMEERT